MSSRAVVTRVPASTSNCGPGFDTLGVALDWHNLVRVQREAEESSCGAKAVPSSRSGLAETAAARFFEAAAIDPFPFSWSITGDVPSSRGLGSSVTVRAGVAGGLNSLCGDVLSKMELAGLIAGLEGHPDNAISAVLGGFCICRICPCSGRFRAVQQYHVPADWRFVLAIPDLSIATNASRDSLPSSVPFTEAARSINSLAWLVGAFVTGNPSLLRDSVYDGLHEPYRLPQVPGGKEALQAGIRTGAWTGWLSGSGSALLCMTGEENADTVGLAMVEVLHKKGLGAYYRVLKADNRGMSRLPDTI